MRDIYGLASTALGREIDISMTITGDVMTRVDTSSSTRDATRRKYPEALKATVLHVPTATIQAID